MKVITIPTPVTHAAMKHYKEAMLLANTTYLVEGAVATRVEHRRCTCGAPVKYDGTLPCGH